MRQETRFDETQMQTRRGNKKPRHYADDGAQTPERSREERNRRGDAPLQGKTKDGMRSGVKISREDVARAYELLHQNMEPCYQGEWRRVPWPTRPYTSFQGYVIAKDVGEDVDRDILQMGLTTPENGDDGELMKIESAALHATIRIKRFPRRKLLSDCLELCPELVAASSPEKDVRAEFIERHLLAALNSLGEQGWNMFEAMEMVRKRAEERGDMIFCRTGERMLQLMQCLEMREWTAKTIDKARLEKLANVTDNFRSHPKGQGVICCRPGGLPKGTFVEEYLGEVYTPRRWFERQDAIKKLNPDSDLPDFYNIQIERPRDDDAGYGVIFVEGASRGNYASRLCHSCAPNCQTVSLCAEGRVTNALFTLREISEGEELTWDYSCVTESEKEYRAAICLCGTSACRGSFLYYADSSAFRDVMSVQHTFLDRTALLLRACQESLMEADKQRLQRNGMKTYALQATTDPDVLIPEWLMKWASLVLEFVEEEHRQLPSKLFSKYRRYTKISAGVEDNGVKANRLQNLFITLDKAKFFLRHQEDNGPPVRFLTDDEIVEYLWTGKNSIVSQALSALKEYNDRLCRNEQAFQKARKRGREESDPYVSQDVLFPLSNASRGDGHEETLTDHILKLVNLHISYQPTTPVQAREGMYRMCETLRNIHPAHAALHDLLFLKASTQYYVTARRCQMIASTPVDLSDVDLPKVLNGGSQYKKRKPRKDVYCKKYKSEFLWAQLVAWYKQTVYDPTASLGAERRGCVCLPSIENLYTEPVLDGTYLSVQRPRMLRMMELKADAQWPNGMIWSYKNVERVYGTPMLDVAIGRAFEEEDAGEEFRQMLDTFKSAFDIHSFNVKPPPDPNTNNDF